MPEPAESPRRSRDAGDDYLLALASSNSAIVVTGDRDLLALSGEFPIYSPSAFLHMLDYYWQLPWSYSGHAADQTATAAYHDCRRRKSRTHSSTARQHVPPAPPV